jgi:membrane fusion protein (multidrug efflux system)
MAVVAGLVIGALSYVHSLHYQSTDDAFIAGHITMIGPRVAGHVAKVAVEDNQYVEQGDLLLELDPRDFEVKLAAAKAAREAAFATATAAKINAELTRVVSYAGLDEAVAAVKLAEAVADTAKSRLHVAQVQLDHAQVAVTVSQATADEAEAGVGAAEAEANRDQLDLSRYEELYKTNTVSQQTLDHAAAQARASQADLEAARKRAAAAKAQVTQTQAAVKVAEGNVVQAQSEFSQAQASVPQAKARVAAAEGASQQVASAEAQAEVAEAHAREAAVGVEQAELELSYTKIHAPAAGRVTRKTAEPGAYVQVGQSVMALVPNDMWVVANFKETQLGRIEPGQRVDVAVDAYPGKVFKGHVDSIQAGSGAAFSLLPPENATGYFIKVVQRVPVKIVFDEPPDLSRYRLGPGMSVVPTVNVSYRPVAVARSDARKGAPARPTAAAERSPSQTPAADRPADVPEAARR